MYIEEKSRWIPPSTTIHVYSDDKKKQEVLLIKDSEVEDFSDSYDVIDAASGQKIGAVGRDRTESFKDAWGILDANNQTIGQPFEKSTGQAIVRELTENAGALPRSPSFCYGVMAGG